MAIRGVSLIVAIGELLWDLLPSGPRPGGAPFNFAFHCHQLGHKAIILSRVGNDRLGHELLETVRRMGLNDQFIQVDPVLPTGTVSVQVDQAGQPKYAIAKNVAWDDIHLEPGYQILAQDADAVCFGTLAQRTKTNRDLIETFVAGTREECLAVCDINFRRPFLTPEIIDHSLHMCDWLKANVDEAEALAAPLSPQFDPPSPRSQSDVLLARLMHAISGSRGLCAITRGSNGCIVANSKTRVEVEGIPIRVADTVGAGDAFTAALLTQQLEGQSLFQSARFANAYAAIVASNVGGTPSVSREEVERLL